MTCRRTTTTTGGTTTRQLPHKVVQFKHQLSTLSINAAITILLIHHVNQVTFGQKTLTNFSSSLTLKEEEDTSQLKKKKIMEEESRYVVGDQLGIIYSRITKIIARTLTTKLPKINTDLQFVRTPWPLSRICSLIFTTFHHPNHFKSFTKVVPKTLICLGN